MLIAVALVAGCTSSETRWEDRSFDEDRSRQAIELVIAELASAPPMPGGTDSLRDFRPAARLVGSLQRIANDDGQRLDARQIARALVADVNPEEIDVLLELYDNYESHEAYEARPTKLSDLDQANLDGLVNGSAIVASQYPALRVDLVDFLDADQAEVDSDSQPGSLQRLKEFGSGVTDSRAWAWLAAYDIDVCRRASAASGADCPTPDSLS